MFEILHLKSTDSTNNEIKRRARLGDVSNLVVIADSQTSGRGRRGNSFLSPVGGLYLSAVITPNASAESVSEITAWIAVAVTKAVLELLPDSFSPKIKWINDIVLNGRKLGGILCETVIEEGRVKYVIAGIGINVLQSEFSGELKGKATSLQMETGIEYSADTVAEKIIGSLEQLKKDYPEKKQDYLEYYRENCATLGSAVTVISADGSKEEAKALSINDNFRLEVETGNGTVKLVDSGEVSVRGLFGYT